MTPSGAPAPSTKPGTQQELQLDSEGGNVLGAGEAGGALFLARGKKSLGLLGGRNEVLLEPRLG